MPAIEAERPGRLQVDDELELGGLHNRQVGRLRTLEDLTAHYAGLTIALTMFANNEAAN